MPHFKLISFPLCPYVQRAMIVLKEKNIDFDVEYINPMEPPPWFYDISPLEKVPVLLVDDKPLFESMVICEYLDEVTPGSLYPEDPFERAQNRAWIEFGNDILSTTFEFFSTQDEKQSNHLSNVLADRFEILEEEFGNGPFFNGDRFMMIDAVYAPIFRYHKFFLKYQDHGICADAEKISQWGDALLQRPSVQNAIPEDYNERLIRFIKSKESIISKTLD